MYSSEAEALRSLLELLAKVEPSARIRLLKAAEAFLGEPHSVPVTTGPQRATNSHRPQTPPRVEYSFTEDRTPSISSFAKLKKPASDVERVTLVAYYQTFYQDQADLTAASIALLYLDSGLPQMRSISDALHHAEQSGYLIRSRDKVRRITSFGREIVEALPDRQKVSEVTKTTRRSRS